MIGIALLIGLAAYVLLFAGFTGRPIRDLVSSAFNPRRAT